MNLFIIDYETTGLNPYFSEVIEVAIKQYNCDHYYQTLIKPSINGVYFKYVSPKITNITGITDVMIEKNGVDPNIALYNTIQYISNNSEKGPIYLMAHNGTTFDFLFFKKAIKVYESSINQKTRSNSINHDLINRIQFVDSLLMAKSTISDASCSQPNLCKRFNIKNEAEHRALGDIKALEQLYKKLCENISYNEGSNEDIYSSDLEKLIDKINFRV